MRSLTPKGLIALLATLAALCVASCGSDNNSADTASGCLSPDQVQQQVDQIAAGVEASQAEVEQKQAAISNIRSRACQ